MGGTDSGKSTRFYYLKGDFWFVLMLFNIFQISSTGKHYFYNIKSKKRNKTNKNIKAGKALECLGRWYLGERSATCWGEEWAPLAPTGSVPGCPFCSLSMSPQPVITNTRTREPGSLTRSRGPDADPSRVMKRKQPGAMSPPDQDSGGHDKEHEASEIAKSLLPRSPIFTERALQ